MNMNVSSWAIRNPVPVILAFILMTIGGLMGFSGMKVQNFPDMDVPTVTVISFDTSPQALVAMQQGKTVAFVNDEMSLVRAMVQLGDQRKDYKLLPTIISIEPLALGIKKGEASFKKVVDDTLREMESNGKADGLYEQWFGQKSSLKMDKRAFKFDSDKVTE